MRSRTGSALIWAGIGGLFVLWLPMVGLYRLLDRDPARYNCGRFFRHLGSLISRINLTWTIEIDGKEIDNPRNPYVVVCNHLSQADIPIICRLPWEMKWVAKQEIVKAPLIGWLMRMVGDLPVDRSSKASGARVLVTARHYLRHRCSVMFFPEGTRSRDGRLGAFSDGAFRLAIKAQVPILPLVIDGSQYTLPGMGWRIGTAHVRLRVLEPVLTSGLQASDTAALRERVRSTIAVELATWRGLPAAAVDALSVAGGGNR